MPPAWSGASSGQVLPQPLLLPRAQTGPALPASESGIAGEAMAKRDLESGPSLQLPSLSEWIPGPQSPFPVPSTRAAWSPARVHPGRRRVQ